MKGRNPGFFSFLVKNRCKLSMPTIKISFPLKEKSRMQLSSFLTLKASTFYWLMGSCQMLNLHSFLHRKSLQFTYSFTKGQLLSVTPSALPCLLLPDAQGSSPGKSPSSPPPSPPPPNLQFKDKLRSQPSLYTATFKYKGIFSTSLGAVSSRGCVL